jgi:hypothetical protein
MKQTFSIALLAFATVGIISCTKTKITNDGPFPIHPPVEQARTIISNWLSMTFTETNYEDGITTYLRADSILNGVSNVDPSKYVAFLYIKMQENSQDIYSRVPLTIANDNENFTIGYSLDNGTLSIMIYNNSTSGQLLSADRFQDCQFRLVMVSAYDYQTKDVDWDDYLAVENAFNNFHDVDEQEQ